MVRGKTEYHNRKLSNESVSRDMRKYIISDSVAETWNKLSRYDVNAKSVGGFESPYGRKLRWKRQDPTNVNLPSHMYKQLITKMIMRKCGS